MYRSTQFVAATLVAALAVACTSSETDPVAPSHGTTARFNITPTATAWYDASPRQPIKGWGVYPAGGAQPFWHAGTIEDAIYRLGVTHVREAIDPALYVSGTSVANMQLNTTLLNQYIAKIAYAKSHGATAYVLAVWSPPAIWKTNHSLLGVANGNVGYLQTWAEPYFVAFVTKVMLALKASNIGLPVAFSIQNEPAHLAPYNGCEYPPDQWQRVMQHVRGSFDYVGLQSVLLFGPETGQYTPALFSNYITRAPGYFGGIGYPSLTGYLDYAVGAYSFHTYAECSLALTQQAVALHPKDMWMTEFGLPSGTTELQWTLDMMAAMGAHLIIEPNNYWFWWMGWSPTTGAPPYGQLLGGTTSPIYSKRYWVLQKMFTTVRPWWRVHSLTTTDPDLQTGMGSQNQCVARVNLMGFSSPDGKTIAILIVNTSSSNKELQIAGLPGAFSVQNSWRTDAWNDMLEQHASNVYKGNSTIAAPANSVVIAVLH